MKRLCYGPAYRTVLKSVGYCLLSPLFLAVVLVGCCCQPHRSHHGSAERERREMLDRLDEKYAPRPLLSEERPRPLTRCNRHDPYNPQSASPLLKLPAELRLRIYRHALGGNVVHLLLKPYRVGHVVCTNDHVLIEGDPQRDCFAEKMAAVEESRLDYRSHFRTHDADSCKDRKTCALPGHLLPESTLSLAFLLSCRRIYCEAIDILYKDNVFDCNHPQTFVTFASTILPERLAQIQSLQLLRTNACDHRAYWYRLWSEVATNKRMPGLKHVSLVVQGFYWRGEREEEVLLRPIAEHLRGLQSFDALYARDHELYAVDRMEPQAVSDLGKRLEGIVCAPPKRPSVATDDGSS